MWSINIETLLKNTTIFSYRKGDCYSQNENYLYKSLWLLSAEELRDPRLVWRELTEGIETIDHVFLEYDTEIQWVIYSYKRLIDSIEWFMKKEKWWYYYPDIVAFYSILWNENFNAKLKGKFLKDQKEYQILEKFRQTRNKFFDHRISEIEWVDSSNTELDIQFHYQDYILVLNPQFDYVQFINILRLIK